MSNAVPKILIGSDPELFLRSRSTGRILSAIGRVGGSKENPSKVFLGALQEDGVVAEINTDPARTAEEFIFNLETVLQALQGKVGDDVELLNISYATLPDEELRNPAAWEIGCTPDFNAWTGHTNRPPMGYEDGMRVAGGHVHIGYENPSDEKSRRIAQMCDYLLGLPSLQFDPDTKRRTLYGKAGSIRYKPYGVEYRTLSNFWVGNEEHTRWVFERATLAAKHVDFLPQLINEFDPKFICDLINNGGKEEVVQHYSNLVWHFFVQNTIPF